MTRLRRPIYCSRPPNTRGPWDSRGTGPGLPNSTVVNEARVGYAHYYQNFQSFDAAENPQNYSFNGSTYHYYSGQTNPLYYGFRQ